MLGRLNIKNKIVDNWEPNTPLELHFCDRLRQHFNFKEEECFRICVICRSALNSHLNSFETIDKTIELIAKNFTPNDVSYNPQIFVIHWRTSINRTLILKELGFNHLKIVQIDSCFKGLLNETPNNLKNMHLYESNTNPLICFLQSVQCPQSLKHDIQSQFESDIDFVSFSTFRRISIAKYLSWKLNCDFQNALKIVDKRSSRMSSTCFSTIALNIELLLNDIQMPVKRLMGSAFLMTVDSNNLLTILKNIKTIAGKPLLELCFKYPTLLDTKCDTLLKNIELLKRFNITDDQILRQVIVLTLNTSGLEKRFLLFSESEELQQFANSPRLLTIIVRLKTVFERLERLKAMGYLTITLDYLIGSKQYFEQVILRFDGFKSARNTIELYLSNCFETDYQSIKSRIGSHPYGSRLNITNANKVIEFFIGLNLTKQQLVNGIFIVLYDYQLVKHQYKLMTNLSQLQPFESNWKSDPFLLQLLIYYIEKNYGFTGNGVYVMSNKLLGSSTKV